MNPIDIQDWHDDIEEAYQDDYGMELAEQERKPVRLRYDWLMFLVCRARIMIRFAYIVDWYLCNVDKPGVDMPLTRLDIDAIVLQFGYDFEIGNLFGRLPRKIKQLENMLTSESPYIHFASWRKR